MLIDLHAILCLNKHTIKPCRKAHVELLVRFNKFLKATAALDENEAPNSVIGKPMYMLKHPPKSAPRLIHRLHALLETLREGPLYFAEIPNRLGAAYPSIESARRMIDRDITSLAALGIMVARTANPLCYTLRGGLPVYQLEDLRTLAVIRDTFDRRHPQVHQIAGVLERLTADLTTDEQLIYERRAVRRAPVRPAIDYTPYADLIAQLEQSITIRQPVAFRYLPSSGREKRHPYVEPYDIEFYDRHFYLVAYTSLSSQILDFRVDRIRHLDRLDQRIPPGTEAKRPLITFRYRLAAALAQGELSQRFESQQIIERLNNGDMIVEAQGRSDFFIIQTLLRYRGNAELLAPDSLRAKMAEEVQKLADLYKGDLPQS
ncbi:MAG: WYL domain-containing protein [Oscillochloris sp.]|nr:WYL domain-containing protein [Oscillochloris sp.]